MPTPRFHLVSPFEHGVGDLVDLPDAPAHHAARVLRLDVGTPVTLFDGRGGEYAARIERIDKRGVAVRILGFDPVERESPLRLVLAQAVAANDAMDYAVRKAVELGVAAIQPLVTQRSAPLPAGERGTRRHLHWQGIAVAACEQCGRKRVPEVAPPVSLAAWLAGWRAAGVMFVPGGRTRLSTLSISRDPLALLVGPEGGLAADEIALAIRAGFVEVNLGPRVLRTETAGPAVIAALQALWGDG